MIESFNGTYLSTGRKASGLCSRLRVWHCVSPFSFYFVVDIPPGDRDFLGLGETS